MDGIHDMGGMAGLGPLDIEQNEPVFHGTWEGRVFALNLSLTSFLPGNLDYGRFMIENIPPADYLEMTYYEKWFDRICDRCHLNGIIDETGLAAITSGRTPSINVTVTDPPVPADLIVAFLQAGNPAGREIDTPPSFNVGDAIRTKNMRPDGHTRMPRYARSKEGVVVAHHGAHVYPDSNAKLEGENPAHLYSVRFRAQTLWGETAHPKDSVTLDLWEPYLERP